MTNIFDEGNRAGICQCCARAQILEDNDICHYCNWDEVHPDQEAGDELDDLRIIKEFDNEK